MTQDSFIEEVAKVSTPIDESEDLLPLIEKLKDKRVVMLGEASHGTKEFYEFRRRLSRELIENHGFSFIAVEGDWPPCQAVDHYIKGETDENVVTTLEHFSRWPTWMWANTTMVPILQWLRDFNRGQSRKVGFHGLDVYSLFESIEVVTGLYPQFKDLYGCFEPYQRDEMAYVRSLLRTPEGCETEVALALAGLLEKNLGENMEFFDAAQNARIIANADKYYRAMVFSQGDDSWNVRDRHMMETLGLLLGHYGPESKGIVWAHNTHVGDYRSTDMVIHHQVNLGGLAREKLGKENVGLVGFSTHRGSVIASHAWDGPIQVFTVPEAQKGSLEDLLKEAVPRVGATEYFLDLEAIDQNSPLREYFGHRAIGVVYSPYLEGRGNYVPTSLAGRYDAMIFLEVTNALVPLNVGFDQHKVPETWPHGARL